MGHEYVIEANLAVVGYIKKYSKANEEAIRKKIEQHISSQGFESLIDKDIFSEAIKEDLKISDELRTFLQNSKVNQIIARNENRTLTFGEENLKVAKYAIDYLNTSTMKDKLSSFANKQPQNANETPQEINRNLKELFMKQLALPSDSDIWGLNDIYHKQKQAFEKDASGKEIIINNAKIFSDTYKRLCEEKEKAWSEEKERLQREYSKNLNLNNSESNEFFENLQKDHQEEISRLKAQHVENLRKIDETNNEIFRKLESKLTEIEDSSAREFEKYTAKNKEELERLKEQHANNLNELKSANEEELNRLAQEKEGYLTKIAELQKELRENESKLKQINGLKMQVSNNDENLNKIKELQELLSKNEERITELANENERLKGELEKNSSQPQKIEEPISSERLKYVKPSDENKDDLSDKITELENKIKTNKFMHDAELITQNLTVKFLKNLVNELRKNIIELQNQLDSQKVGEKKVEAGTGTGGEEEEKKEEEEGAGEEKVEEEEKEEVGVDALKQKDDKILELVEEIRKLKEEIDRLSKCQKPVCDINADASIGVNADASIGVNTDTSVEETKTDDDALTSQKETFAKTLAELQAKYQNQILALTKQIIILKAIDNLNTHKECLNETDMFDEIIDEDKREISMSGGGGDPSRTPTNGQWCSRYPVINQYKLLSNNKATTVLEVCKKYKKEKSEYKAQLEACKMQLELCNKELEECRKQMKACLDKPESDKFCDLVKNSKTPESDKFCDLVNGGKLPENIIDAGNDAELENLKKQNNELIKKLILTMIICKNNFEKLLSEQIANKANQHALKLAAEMWNAKINSGKPGVEQPTKFITSIMRPGPNPFDTPAVVSGAGGSTTVIKPPGGDVGGSIKPTMPPIPGTGGTGVSKATINNSACKNEYIDPAVIFKKIEIE